MRRLAYICADGGVPVFGRKGSSVHVQEVIRALKRQGSEVVLFAVRLGGEAPADLADLHVVLLPEIHGPDPAQRERAALDLNPQMARLLGEHGHFDAVYERHSLWSFAAMEWARARGIPGLLEVNAPLLVEQASYRTLHDPAAAREAVARAYAAASAVLAVSQAVADYVCAFADSLSRKVHVVPNGVDPARFEAAYRGRMQPRSHHGISVGFVGTLKPWHGVEMLVEAFARVHPAIPQSRLMVVGDGTQRESLEVMVQALGLHGAVEFTGAVDPASVPGRLAMMDVAVAPYPDLKDFYFSPLKVYEYMAAGCAIVASAIGQITEVLRDGETGLLYPPGHVEALAEAIQRLHSDASLRRRLGQRAREAVRRLHTWDSVAKRILHLMKHGTPGNEHHATASPGLAGSGPHGAIEAARAGMVR